MCHPPQVGGGSRQDLPPARLALLWLALAAATQTFVLGCQTPGSAAQVPHALPGFEVLLPDWEVVRDDRGVTDGKLVLRSPDKGNVEVWWEPGEPDAKGLERQVLASYREAWLADTGRTWLDGRRADWIYVHADGGHGIWTTGSCSPGQEITIVTRMAGWPRKEMKRLHDRVVASVECGELHIDQVAEEQGLIQGTAPGVPAESDERLVEAGQLLEEAQLGNDAAAVGEGIAKLREAVKENPDNAAAHALLYAFLARKLATQRDEDVIPEMKEEYALALRTADTDLRDKITPPWLALGFYYLHSGAEHRDKKRDEYLAKARETVAEGLEQNPANAEGHSLMARIELARGDHEAAVASAEEAARLAPDVVDHHLFVGELHRNAVHDEAALCWSQESIDSGIAAYRRGLALDPDRAQARAHLGWLLRHNHAYDDAVAEAREAVTRADTPANRRMLGSELLFAGHDDEAIVEFQRSLERDPEHLPAQGRIAFVYLLQGNYAQAVVEFEKYRRADPMPAPYAILDYHLALRGLGLENQAKQILDTHAASFDYDAWAAEIREFYKGKLAEKALIARAETRCQLAKAAFYAGYAHLLDGDRPAAAASFQRTVEAGVHCYGAHLGATRRLAEIESDTSTSARH